MSKLNNFSERFVDSLIKLKIKDDRTRLAELRRGLSETTRTSAYGAVAFLGGRLDITHITIAGLFALHPETSSDCNIGTTWRELRRQAYNSIPAMDEKLSSFEHRFNRLLSCSTKEELCEHLRPFIAFAKSKKSGINYAALHRDIDLWEIPNANIRLEWAKEYWRRTKAPEPISPNDAAEEE